MQLLTIGDGLSISAVDYASRANAILGIRDSGKTTTAKKIAEGLYESGIPFFAFDPSGRWRFMRSPDVIGGGERVGEPRRGSRGFPVVVLGGAQPDLPLVPDKAHEVVRAAMRAGVSLVVDLYEKGLSKSAWRQIVQECVRTIFYENEEIGGLRHVFLEEAAEFVPQRPYDGATYAEVEKLVRMGGNAGVGITIINQRAEEVNKAVLELCDNLLLHRQRGKNSLLSLKKWLTAVEGDVKDITTTLAGLPAGECWAWFRDGDGPKRIKIAPLQSLHPDRRFMFSGKATTVTRVDVSAFLASMQSALAGKKPPAPSVPPKAKREEPDVKESEAKALRDENAQQKRTIETLTRKVEELERRLAALPAQPTPEATGQGRPTYRPADIDTGDFDALYAAIKQRAQSDPAVLRLLAAKPEIEVRIERKVVTIDGSTLKGKIARLIASGFYDQPRSNTATTAEIKRTAGTGVNFGNLARELKALAGDGFLTAEASGYLAVPDMKVNVVEA
jgi:hypothetical protein